uniref:ATP synthase complex subunit 8 n=1 Tax=Stolotermes victoriensis TaxID=2910475 RepID=A0A977PMB8_9NEOP|nr:ATP synthase F0 subunit 8 [Stolotermes victoriensis]
MPQMMPLSWLTLMLMFSVSLMLFNTMNYFSFSPNAQQMSTKTMLTKKMNWKW